MLNITIEESELLNMGALTQKEFDDKKKDIFNKEKEK